MNEEEKEKENTKLKKTKSEKEVDSKENRGIYIHIPFCKQKCGYCDFNSFQGKEEYEDRYIEALKKEIILFSKNIENEDKKIDTIFFGGGTPSLVAGEKIKEILETIYENFEVLKDSEITVECNPESVTEEKMEIYKKAGVNRISMGMQSLDNDILKIIGRIHDKEEAYKKYEIINKYFENKSVDLMFGLPNQTVEIFKKTVDEVIEKFDKLTHISVYSLILEEGTPFYTNNNILDNLPTEEDERIMHEYARNKLREAGYDQYEISNFAKEEKVSKHNLNCWNHHEYYGFGIGAASFYNNIRYVNNRSMIRYIEKYLEGKEPKKFNILGKIEKEKYKEKEQEQENENEKHNSEKMNKLEEYIEKNYIVQEKLNKKEYLEEEIILALRTRYGFKKEILEYRELKKHKEIIEKYIQKGMLKEEKGYISLTDKGINIANIIWKELLDYDII